MQRTVLAQRSRFNKTKASVARFGGKPRAGLNAHELPARSWSNLAMATPARIMAGRRQPLLQLDPLCRFQTASLGRQRAPATAPSL